MLLAVLVIIIYSLAAAFLLLGVIGLLCKPDSVFKNRPEETNPMENRYVEFVFDDNDKENADGVKGHLVAVEAKSSRRTSFYEKFVKRFLDVLLSFLILLCFSPVFLIIALCIFFDDPGKVIFTQKRIGQNKRYFKLHKFRSMKLSTPHDIPTHMLQNPENYITKVGGFIRRHSLDELPQIWDIFIGNMSFIGPRPALWNQDLLTAERDKFFANDIKPGLTGLAQINGRDELSIEEKAGLDGKYVENIGFASDLKCFLGTLHVFKSDDSISEGKSTETTTKTEIEK